MRIACLYLPGFMLQVHTRSAPHLLGTHFGVLQEAEGAAHKAIARVAAASQGAIAEGIRVGMTATQARAAARSVRLVDATPAAYAEAMRALGEAALALSVTVDIREPGVVYALVPPGARGATFGERLREAGARQGLRGRVGIADDRFTAWAATHAQPRQPVRAVPAHGSAEFLAPLPLDLLPLDEDVRRTLVLLGVKTIGDFASLPPPSVGRRFERHGVDVQALARGDDPRSLHAFVPVEPIRETADLEAEVTELEPISFVLRPIFERAVARLAGRGRAAARTVVALHGRATEITEVTIVPSRPTTSARTLIDLARAHLAERRLTHAVLAVEVTITEEGEAEAQELDLLERAAAAPGAVDVAIARLRAAFGPDCAFAAQLADRHRPEGAYEPVPFDPPVRRAGKPPRRSRAASLLPRVVPVVAGRGAGALRLIEPPTTLETDGGEADVDPAPPPRTIRVDGAARRVVESSGPTRLEGEWWTDEPLARDYYEVSTEDGGRYWLYRDHADGRFYLHGVFD